MRWDQLSISVLSGVTVAFVIAISRVLWRNKRVPTGMSRRVTRRNYLYKILLMSREERVDQMVALVPNLVPANNSLIMQSIQHSWAEINRRRSARVVTREDRNSLIAGAELLSQGVEVRAARELNTDNLSYHVFYGDVHRVMLNRRTAGHDRPEMLEGVPLAKLFHGNFEQVWGSALPLESLFAEQVLAGLAPSGGGATLPDLVRELRLNYKLNEATQQSVMRHIAFRQDASVIFVIGLPGSGKSFVRRHLGMALRNLRLSVDERSDYVYAFEDFLHGLLRFEDRRGAGFTAEEDGAFCVDSEERLQPALHMLSSQIIQNRHSGRITIAEFARSDVVAALRVFGDELLSASQVIYVQASDATRARRLAQRGQPPKMQATDHSICLEVSDDHRLTVAAAASLYTSDNAAMLDEHRNLSGRVHYIDNDKEALDADHLSDFTARFMSSVIRPYKHLLIDSDAPTRAFSGQPALSSSTRGAREST